jgi:hypothetical protein
LHLYPLLSVYCISRRIVREQNICIIALALNMYEQLSINFLPATARHICIMYWERKWWYRGRASPILLDTSSKRSVSPCLQIMYRYSISGYRVVNNTHNWYCKTYCELVVRIYTTKI